MVSHRLEANGSGNGATASMPKALACPICGQAHALEAPPVGMIATCCRCGATLDRPKRNSLFRTAAFALSALLLYVPANMLPILQLELYGSHTDSTVWDGVIIFYRGGNYVMAAIVLLASITIPFLKLAGLFFLVMTTFFNFNHWKLFRTWLYRIIDVIGRWAMLDVFVLAIWVATVKLERLGSVTPGPALLPFGGVVVFTLLASASFDPRLIWQKERRAQ